MVCREALNQHVDNMRTLMTHTIYNELSNSRNPNNMALLQAMFQHNSELAAKVITVLYFCHSFLAYVPVATSYSK